MAMFTIGAPDGRITLIAKATHAAAATNAPALPATANKLNYITGFDVTGGGATGASVIEITVTGLTTAVGTLFFDMEVLAGAGAAVNTRGGLSVRFPDPIPASAINSAITLTVPSLGSGNTSAAATVYGFQL